jgi:hypothetical protein
MHLLLIVLLVWLIMRPRKPPNSMGCLIVLVLIGGLLMLHLIATIVYKLLMVGIWWH